MSNLPADIQNGVNNVRNTFSSWDTCMAKSYCKWPVIAGIIIGSIILLSVVWCIASCLCCGATLCGSCVRCLTCFNCCGACGKRGGGGSGRTRHKDDYTSMAPGPYNGYQSQTSPMAYQPPSSGPQFAQFDASSKNIHADSLPAMPSWDTARTKRVEHHVEPIDPYNNDVEMGAIGARNTQPRTKGGYNRVPNGPTSPVTAPANYGQFEGQAHPYASDIGTQRLGQQQTGHTYSDFDPSPLSPAPTYRTNPIVASVAATDRFRNSTLSPTPSQYQSQHHSTQRRDQAWSPLSSGQHEAGYESYRRSLSPPAGHHSPTYGYESQDNSGYRPPSLLQVGRKPVNGSQREI